MSDWELVEDSPESEWEVTSEFTQKKPQSALDLAREQISQAHPDMPAWLREGLLSLVGNDSHPALQKTANVAEHFNRAVQGTGLPAASRGLLSGLIAPARTAGYLVPGEIGEKMRAPLPDAPLGAAPQIPGTGIQIPLNQMAEFGGDILGVAASGGPIFKGIGQAVQAARIPRMVGTPLVGAATGAVLSPDIPFAGAALGAAAPAATKAGKFVFEDLGSIINTLRKEQRPLESFNKMLQKHDALDAAASQLYGHSDKMVQGRDLKPFRISDDVFEPAEIHLSKTPENKKLIQMAKKGDYEALNQLQSDLGKEANAMTVGEHVSQADRNAAKELMSARKRINKTIDDQLIREGHSDIAAVRNQANKLYRQKMETYFDKNLPLNARKVFMKGKRLMPGQTDLDLIKPFMERSNIMEEFLAKHPEMMEEVNLARAKKAAIAKLNPINKAVRATGFGGGLFKAAELLRELL